jgi:glycosyltransferase involved in cell wall biosynthesis
MKILLVQDTDWIARNVHQQHHLLERLRLRGHEITVIDYELLWRTNDKNRFLKRRQVFRGESKVVNNAEITVIRPAIVTLPFLDYVSMFITYYQEISAQLRDSPPDVLIGMYVLSNFLALRASKRKNIPFVFLVTDLYHELIPAKPLRPIGKLMESAVFAEADEVVVINEELKEYAAFMGAHPEQISVIRAGIDLERFGPQVEGRLVRERYGIEDHETVLFFMGWLYQFSGMQEILTELAKHRRNDVRIRVLIVGDGDAYEELEQMRKDLRLESSVILAGKQPYDKIPEFIAAADICLLPAHNNKIMRHVVPIKMYEYMAMGKPVIATALPGVMKEFGIENGVLYIERPEDALEKAMELIKADAIEAQGEKAREYIKDYDWGSVVDQFEKTLRRAVAAQQRQQEQSD